MRVFITGVAGFLGSHLADAWLANGAEVGGIDSLIGGDINNVPSGVVFNEMDCTALPHARNVMADADLVYHCAATAYEGLSVFSPTIVTQNIVMASVATITAAIKAGVKRFVYCSSMARYGAQPAPFYEWMTPHPQDPYGIGKVAGEQLLKNLAETHGMEWTVVVPHNIIGPRQKYDDPYRNVASIMINRMLQGKQPIIYGDGEQMRCFSFVQDVVEPLLAVGVRPDCHKRTFNVGPEDEYITINELARTIASILKFKLDPIYMPARPQEVRYANCSAVQARAWLGYKPETTLREGLQAMVTAIQTRGPKPFNYHLPVEIKSDLTPETWTKRLI